MKNVLKFTVNGIPYTVTTDHNTTLLNMLRDELRLTGTKEACGTGDCGACTVIVNGKTVCSCIYLASDVDGKDVLTVEGMAHDGKLDPIQEAFIAENAVQCGFCTAGMLMSAKALLDEHPAPTDQQIKDGMSGNLCRCTGYTQIANAIKAAAKAINDNPHPGQEV